MLADRSEAPVRLSFQRVGRKQSFAAAVQDGRFAIDLPAGEYLLSGFVDTDNSGRRDLGTIIPFSTAETQAHYTDTISVRARFETTGIEFTIY